MNHLQRALRAEILKLRRTLVLWITLLSPSTVAFLYFLILLSANGQNAYDNDPEAWWGLTKSVCSIWTAAMLPLFITLKTALLGNIEHSQRHWKHLFALAVPRTSLFGAKWLVAVSLAGLASAILLAEIIGTGLFMRWMRPQMGFGHPMPLWMMVQTVGGTFLASLLVISIHTWVGLRFQSFAFASGFGIAATITNIMVMNSEKWGQLYPWALSLHSYANQNANLPRLYALAIGGGLLAALLGALEVARRDVLE